MNNNQLRILTQKSTGRYTSGKNLDRPGYQSLKIGIGKLVNGDTLIIKSLDRLSRNKEDAKKELQYFSSIGVRVKILDLPIILTVTNICQHCRITSVSSFINMENAAVR